MHLSQGRLRGTHPLPILAEGWVASANGDVFRLTCGSVEVSGRHLTDRHEFAARMNPLPPWFRRDGLGPTRMRSAGLAGVVLA